MLKYAESVSLKSVTLLFLMFLFGGTVGYVLGYGNTYDSLIEMSEVYSQKLIEEKEAHIAEIKALSLEHQSNIIAISSRHQKNIAAQKDAHIQEIRELAESHTKLTNRLLGRVESFINKQREVICSR